MTRQFFWVAAALALSLPLHTVNNRAVAQQTGDASAEAETDSSDASADASTDSDASSNDQAEAQPETSDNSSTQAESDSSASDDTSHADTKTKTSDESAKDETQRATPATPPPSTQTDPNANQSREQSRVVEGQQPNQQDRETNRNRADASRDRTDDSVQGRDRDNRGERNRRDRENDLRVGIQFGRATDRGLAINHIDQNSFYYRNGFRRGDLVVSVHGRPVRNDADFMRFFVLEQGQRVPIVVLRDGRRETIYVQYRDIAQNQRGFDNQQYRAGGAYLGVTFDAQVRDAAVVASVNPGSPAQEAGLQAGDILLALNGQEIRSYPDAISMIRAMRPGDELEIVVERARGERQIVAMLDAAPSVRTAGRPDVQLERRTIDQPARVQVELDDDYDDDRFDRNRDSEDNRGRGILPRLRN